MESSGTDAPLSPDPTCSAALLAPSVPRRSTPPCFSLPVLTGVGRGQGCCLPKAGAVSLEGHRARAGAEQRVARLRAAARGAPCPGLDAAGCQADPYLPTAAGQGSGISMGASAPAAGCQLCKLGGALSAGHALSEAGLRLASGGGTGYSSIRRLLTRDPFTRRDAPTGAVG